MIGIKIITKFITIGLILSIYFIAGCSYQLPEYKNYNIDNLLKEQAKKQSSPKSEKKAKKAEDDKYYKVVRIVDGDTIIVNMGSKNERVRLIGVNTPESVKPNASVQKYGKEASNFTKKLLEKKRVRLEFDIQERDKYYRLLAYVYLPDGKMVNKILLQEGYAQVMTVPPNVKYQKEFIKLQRKAREEKKGLWK